MIFKTSGSTHLYDMCANGKEGYKLTIDSKQATTYAKKCKSAIVVLEVKINDQIKELTIKNKKFKLVDKEKQIWNLA